MKLLYLVRHAKSSWANMSLADHDRPLNNRGKRNAPEMGKRLHSRGILPDLLISSTAKRALSTAKKIALEINYEPNKIRTSRFLFHAGEEDIVELIRQQDNNLDSLMLFGHNPGFTYCVNLLSNAGIDNVPTCGIIAISFDTDSWRDIERDQGKLTFFDYPKKLP